MVCSCVGAGRGIPSNFKRAKEERYAFDRVFDENATQEEVFANTTKHLIDGVLKGFNASVFAYGATGTPLPPLYVAVIIVPFGLC